MLYKHKGINAGCGSLRRVKCIIGVLQLPITQRNWFGLTKNGNTARIFCFSLDYLLELFVVSHERKVHL